jgi:hypothetical protein
MSIYCDYDKVCEESYKRPGHAGEKHEFHDWKSGVDAKEVTSDLHKRRCAPEPVELNRPEGPSLLIVIASHGSDWEK